MRLAVISAKFPFGPHEPYLDVELRALAPYFSHISVIPTSPGRDRIAFTDIAADVRRLDIASLRTAAGAVRALFSRPRQALAAIFALFTTRSTWRIKLKNIAVLPLGLAVGDALRRGRYDHVHAYWLSTPATVAYLAAAVAELPWSSTGHRWDIYENNALRLKLASAVFVRAISERGRTDILRIAGGACRAKLETVHLGVETPHDIAPPPNADPERPLALLCAANLVPVKGHADLFHAMALLRSRGVPVTCTVAGQGSLRAELEALANTLEIAPAIVFRGTVEHETLLAELHARRYDAMVLASREQPGGLMEGIPVALMEAMAAGVPVIATRTGSIPELVNEECGCLVPQGDPEALAAAIEAVLRDPALRARLSEAAIRRIRAHFDASQLAQRLASLIRAV